MKFTFKHMNQTQIGKLFGVTSHVVGNWLREVGLRLSDGSPSEMAHEGGFCKTVPSGASGYYWAWHSERTIAALRAAGYSVIPNSPHNLIRPAILSGPFCVRKSASSDSMIENGDGSVSLWTSNPMTADVVTRILNVAHSTGVIDRLCQPQRLLQMTSASLAEVDTVIIPFE
jgi:hypothetical protein